MSLLRACQLCGDLGLLRPAPGGAAVCKTCWGVANLAATANQLGVEEDQLIEALGVAAATLKAQRLVRA